MFRSNIKFFLAFSVTAILLVVFQTYAVWQDAPAAPAQYGTVPGTTQDDYKPVNLGGITQTKSGSLNILGSVGIGAEGPQAPLHILGSIDAPSNSATPNGGVMIGGAGTGVQMSMGVTADASPQYGWIQPRYSNNSNVYNLVLNPNGGNVGIGTTTPPGYKLDIAGAANVTDLCIDGICKADWNAVGGGTVTSVTAGYGLSSSPSPIITTGTISLNLSSAHTWTAMHTFSGGLIIDVRAADPSPPATGQMWLIQ